MRFRITKIVKGKWTDASLSDCMSNVFFTPGHVELVTVDEFQSEHSPVRSASSSDTTRLVECSP